MNRIVATLVAVLAVAPAAALAQDHSQMDHSKMGHSAAEISAASTAYMDAMAKMDADMKAMTMTGKPGADFMLMMIPHHQAAIDMANAYLASDEKDPEITRLSEEIIVAQEKEIAFMRDWLKRNGH